MTGRRMRQSTQIWQVSEGRQVIIPMCGGSAVHLYERCHHVMRSGGVHQRSWRWMLTRRISVAVDDPFYPVIKKVCL